MRQLNLPIPGSNLDSVVLKAQELLEAHIKEFKKNPKNEIDTTGHYKEFKELLMSNQFDKCAYCECKSENQTGDVEHFRPKGRVKEIDGSTVKVDFGDKDSARHPGYFWLAYDLRNLFMSCMDCNRARYHKDARSKKQFKAGKADVFPIMGKRAFKPEDKLEEEDRLLIKPTDDPSEHMELEYETGKFKPLSKKGSVTIKLLGLNKRENLRQGRVKAAADAQTIFRRYVDAKESGPDFIAAQVEREIYDLITERSIYFTAAKLGWEVSKKKHAKGIIDALINEITSQFSKND